MRKGQVIQAIDSEAHIFLTIFQSRSLHSRVTGSRIGPRRRRSRFRFSNAKRSGSRELFDSRYGGC